MTAAQLALIYNVSSLSSPTDRGVSEQAAAIRKRVDQVLDDFKQSFSLGEMYGSISSLFQVAGESALPDWDGYGACPANLIAVDHACRFLRTLPATLKKPELSIDPDGEISFEWYLEPRRVFTVSIGSSSKLSYAGLFGRSDTHGTEYFGDELPKAIMDNLCRLFSHRD
jgi:hypothetical protein